MEEVDLEKLARQNPQMELHNEDMITLQSEMASTGIKMESRGSSVLNLLPTYGLLDIAKKEPK